MVYILVHGSIWAVYCIMPPPRLRIAAKTHLARRQRVADHSRHRLELGVCVLIVLHLAHKRPPVPRQEHVALACLLATQQRPTVCQDKDGAKARGTFR